MSVASDIFNGLGVWITREERKAERDDAAIKSLLSALSTTKIYIAQRDRGEPIDREKESKLVELWTAAAVQVRRSDEDLAMRLQEKADYWTNPENWTPDEVSNNRIHIDQITRDSRRLLGGHEPVCKKKKAKAVLGFAVLVVALALIAVFAQYIPISSKCDSKMIGSLIDRGREPIRGKVDTCRLYLHDVAMCLRRRGNPLWHEFDNASHSRDPDFLANQVNEVVPILESMQYKQ